MREDISKWLLPRLGFFPFLNRRSQHHIPRTTRPDAGDDKLKEIQSIADRSVVLAEPASESQALDSCAEKTCRITIVGAPHPTTERLFHHITALVQAREADELAVVLNLAKSMDAQALPADMLIYLRSDCASAVRIAAVSDIPNNARILRAATLITRLDDRYRNHPNLSVEAALLHPPYLALRLSELMGLTFGLSALRQAQASFAERALDAQMYCDPAGYLAAVEVDGVDPEPARDALRPAFPQTSETLTLVARMLEGVEQGAILFVARDADAARLSIDLTRTLNIDTDIRVVEGALRHAHDGVLPYRFACLFDVADEPGLPELVKTLDAAGLALCGVESSVERMRRLCCRCVDFGIGHNLTFAFEGAQWKALPRALFEG